MVDDPRDEDEDEVDESQAFPCQICGETFDTQQDLEEHGAKVHEDSDQDYDKHA